MFRGGGRGGGGKVLPKTELIKHFPFDPKVKKAEEETIPNDCEKKSEVVPNTSGVAEEALWSGRQQPQDELQGH